ncbi:unnamed protein product [Paramecium octaurelia]|uniref:Uncharacterized protein n=1 Tax=Paramecium octaurelia TaxID=43137 RepID=A0A8S1X722_PAROT|nr:unnamed protein product [Paramecium octaurelia]
MNRLEEALQFMIQQLLKSRICRQLRLQRLEEALLNYDSATIQSLKYFLKKYSIYQFTFVKTRTRRFRVQINGQINIMQL